MFLSPFLHCKALRTAMYKCYINSIIIIIIIIIRDCSFKERSMILLIGKDKHSAYSLSIQFGISSGRHALEGFNAVNNLKIRISETFRKLRCFLIDAKFGQRLGQAIFFKRLKEGLVDCVWKFLVSKIFNSFNRNVTRNVPRVWVETAQAFDLLPPNLGILLWLLHMLDSGFVKSGLAWFPFTIYCIPVEFVQHWYTK